MSRLDLYKDLIADLAIQRSMTHVQIAEYIKVNYGECRGFSDSSVRQFCRTHGIKTGGRLPASDDQLTAAVTSAIEQVGPSYGRKMMTGFLASKGVVAGETRVGRVLRQCHEPYNQARQQGARNLNPVPYHAEYFGHKLHMDQNEKIGMFGAVHVLAIDGYSSKIVAWKTMPAKNNLIIYDSVYRSAVRQYGLWDQVRVDHGTEFYLSLYMQEKNAALRRNTARQPYIQTQSKRNHTVERIWPEINQRVNHPIKSALVQLMDSDALNLEDSTVQFCVSSLCILLAEIGINQVVESWNAHRIPGKGIPNRLSQNSMAAPIAAALTPLSSTAAQWYASDLGTVLTVDAVFGQNPWVSTHAKQQCETQFSREVPDLQTLLNSAVNGDARPLQASVLRLIELTSQLS